MILTANHCQRKLLLMQEFMMSNEVPRLTTGKVWRKSPHNTTILPPNAWSFFCVRSLSNLSTVSKAYLWPVVASSHKIRWQLRMRWLCGDVGVIFETEFSFRSSGKPNRVVAVRPPSRRDAAIPNCETGKQSLSLERRYAMIVWTKILLLFVSILFCF